MTALPLSAYQQNSGSPAVKQRDPETLLKQLLLEYQSLDPDRPLEEGSTTQGLGCKTCWVPLAGAGTMVVASPMGEVLLLQWKELQDKVGRLVHREQG